VNTVSVEIAGNTASIAAAVKAVAVPDIEAVAGTVTAVSGMTLMW
jgi:hypothetical protein